MSEDNDLEVVPSRAERKRQIELVRQLVVRLLELNDRELKRLELPEHVLEPLAEAKTIKRGSAKQRQIRLLTQLVDELDSADLVKRITQIHHGSTPRKSGHGGK